MFSTVLADPTAAKGGAGSYLIYLLLPVAFYFLVIRPQRIRAKRITEVQSTLTVGTEVITTAGVYGRIVAENEDDTILLEIAPNVPIRIARAAIARTTTPVVAETDASVDPDEPPAST